MTAKRQATTELNHDNWNDDEEPEKRGTFSRAPDDELKNRVIKRARRKVTDTTDADNGGTATKSIFSGFGGFGKSAKLANTTNASPFSFLSKLPAAAPPVGGSTSGSNAAGVAPKFSFGSAVSTSDNAGAVQTNIINNKKTAEKSTIYYAKLKGLNQTVSDWIKTHVDKNPICLLTPIFKDYENYLNEIEKEEANGISFTSTQAATNTTITKTNDKGDKAPSAISNFKFSATPVSTSGNSTEANVAATTTTKPAATFSFGLSASSTTATTSGSNGNASSSKTSIFSKPTTETDKTNGFSFDLKKDDKPKSTISGFSFGNSGDNAASGTQKPTGFSFTPGSTPFSFGNIQPPAAVSASNAAEEDEEELPPKVEFTQVVEDDAVYSKKCKVFVKKDGNFVDRGVGTLYLKPVKDAEKTQLIVRADTNLGNVLVNLILSDGLPTQRMGKNNVMMVCLPTPDVEKPTSMLLRVKTAEEADELLENINKYKK